MVFGICLHNNVNSHSSRDSSFGCSREKPWVGVKIGASGEHQKSFSIRNEKVPNGNGNFFWWELTNDVSELLLYDSRTAAAALFSPSSSPKNASLVSRVKSYFNVCIQIGLSFFKTPLKIFVCFAGYGDRFDLPGVIRITKSHHGDNSIRWYISSGKNEILPQFSRWEEERSPLLSRRSTHLLTAHLKLISFSRPRPPIELPP